MRTYFPSNTEVSRQWHLVDAQGLVLGRLATEVATLLRGKHKAMFTPHLDTGDHVIVINTSQIVLTSDKAQKKIYYRHSGYPGGLSEKTFSDLLKSESDEVVRRAVKGMLPKGPLGRQMLKKLKVYSGPTHPHAAQLPKQLDLASAQRIS